MPSSRSLASLLVVASLAGGCLTGQREEVIEARAAYHACVEENPEDSDRACAALKAEVLVREERYIENSWGPASCGDASQGMCGPAERAPRGSY
ncbi:MAG: hypothetical protein VX466_00845 [Myxococcota bacterium]|nr:hypothetical protein [Myxococcota bacterium]